MRDTFPLLAEVIMSSSFTGRKCVCESEAALLVAARARHRNGTNMALTRTHANTRADQRTGGSHEVHSTVINKSHDTDAHTQKYTRDHTDATHFLSYYRYAGAELFFFYLKLNIVPCMMKPSAKKKTKKQARARLVCSV